MQYQLTPVAAIVDNLVYAPVTQQVECFVANEDVGGSNPLWCSIWAVGMLGVFISLAPRNSAGFDSLTVHHLIMSKQTQYKGDVATTSRVAKNTLQHKRKS